MSCSASHGESERAGQARLSVHLLRFWRTQAAVFVWIINCMFQICCQLLKSLDLKVFKMSRVLVFLRD